MPNYDKPLKEEEEEAEAVSAEEAELGEAFDGIAEEGADEAMADEAMAEEEGGSGGGAEEALAAALETHGPGDPAKLLQALESAGFELSSPDGMPSISIGVGLESVEGEAPDMGSDMGLEMPEELDITSMRNAAAGRAFDKFEKGEVPKGRYS